MSRARVMQVFETGTESRRVKTRIGTVWIDKIHCPLCDRMYRPRDIRAHLESLRAEGVCRSCSAAGQQMPFLAEVSDWQNRASSRWYPIVFLDALPGQSRMRKASGQESKAVSLALGVTPEGER